MMYIYWRHFSLADIVREREEQGKGAVRQKFVNTVLLMVAYLEVCSK